MKNKFFTILPLAMAVVSFVFAPQVFAATARPHRPSTEVNNADIGNERREDANGAKKNNDDSKTKKHTATTLTVSPAIGTYGATTSLTSILLPAVSGKTISFSLNGVPAGTAVTDNSGMAVLPNASLLGINAGSYPTGVSASFAGDASYAASGGTASLTVNKAATTLSVTGYSIPYNGGSFSLTATMTPAVSGETISFYLVDPSLYGTTIAFTGNSGAATAIGMNAAGINVGDYPVGINASFAGDANYAPSSASADLNITKISQAITTFNTLSDATYGDADFTLGAFSNSGLFSVTFSASPATVCSVSGNTAHIIGVGLCTITASQAGNSNYSPAPDVSQTFTINPLAVLLTGTRPYDGTTDAPAGILSVSNKVGSDDVTASDGVGTLGSADIGSQPFTSFGTLVLGGTGAGNYTLTGATGYVNITAP